MAKRKLLVVDDDVALVEMLKDHFEFEGFEVFKAFDGAAAIEMTLSKKPDLILLDINMPGMDGLEACRRLKEDAETKAIPILMLSADTHLKMKQQILAIGATACMMKPFTIDAITAAVCELLPLPPLIVPLQA
jgi:DNA-binding response OmpR family regulator